MAQQNCRSSRKKFLNNTTNKANFISLLSTRLQSSGFEVRQSSGDADFLICKTAISLTQSRVYVPVVVFAADTDILVMLIAHTAPDMDNLYMQFNNKELEFLIQNLS